MSLSLTAIQTIEWVTRILSIYFFVDSAGNLIDFRNYRENDFFGRAILKTSSFYRSHNRFIRAILDGVLEFRVWFLIILIRGFSGIVLFFLPQQNLLSTFCLLFLFLSSSVINLQIRPFRPETDNRFALQISGALLLLALVPTPLVSDACMWFIALMSCITYATAGISKLFEKEWRVGNGLIMAINAREMIFSDTMILFLNRHKKLLKIMTWMTIAMDSLFPLVFIAGPPYFLFFIAWGVCFHLFIAIFLRLGKFFWVWISTYPAIIYIAIKIHQ